MELQLADILFIVVVSVISTVILIFVIIYISISTKFILKARKIKSDSYNTRIYLIDIKEQLVTFFNKKNLRIKRHLDWNGFFEKFYAGDAELVKNWIDKICNDTENVEPFLGIRFLKEKGKSSTFCLLKLIKYNKDNQIIHLESSVLQNISPTQKAKMDKLKSKQGLINFKEAEKIIENPNCTGGFTFNINFFDSKQNLVNKDNLKKFLIFMLKNEIYSYIFDLRNPRYLIEADEKQLFVFDLNIFNEEEAVKLAEQIKKSLERCIAINGFANFINFSIGITNNALYDHEFNLIIGACKEASLSGERTNKTIVINQKNEATKTEIQKYGAQINKLISENAIDYYFRPIFNIKTKSVLGYFNYIKTKDSKFKSYRDLSKLASLCNKNKDIFQKISFDVFEKFSDECKSKSCKLFLKVSLADIDYAFDIIGELMEKYKLKLVLIFDEQEINENASDLNVLNQTFKNLEGKYFELGMLMKDKNLLLDPSVYKHFDYFVAGSSMVGEIKVNNRSRLSIHTLIEQLLPNNKPIIVTDLESWASIELIVKSGIYILSSEVISSSASGLGVLDRKKIDRMIELYDKYN